MRKNYNITHGERYGEGEEQKTFWNRVGVLIVNKNYEGIEPTQEEIAVLDKLIKGGFLRIKMSATPVSANYDGWLSIFEQRDREAPSSAEISDAESVISNAGGTEIDLSEIPF